uniref:Uncharacterized protein n=1 Tax=Timema tahoe TaxID=61484 RepID=A0A7R9NVL6_9NEOP|nr:unnamed protein product [Timema tahoe]
MVTSLVFIECIPQSAVTYYVEMTEVAGLLAGPSGALKVVSERRYEVGPPTNLTQDLCSLNKLINFELAQVVKCTLTQLIEKKCVTVVSEL